MSDTDNDLSDGVTRGRKLEHRNCLARKLLPGLRGQCGRQSKYERKWSEELRGKSSRDSEIRNQVLEKSRKLRRNQSAFLLLFRAISFFHRDPVGSVGRRLKSPPLSIQAKYDSGRSQSRNPRLKTSLSVHLHI